MEIDADSKYASEGSNEDDLPDLKDIFSFEPTEIKSGDIVWARFRKLYWPSIVKTIYKKDKKVSISYLDSPGKSFKVSLKGIHHFNDFEFSRRVQEDVEKSELRDLHEKTMISTFAYMKRRADGCNDDPTSYFDSTKPYLSLYEAESSKKESSDTELNTTNESLQCKINNDDEECLDDECLVESEAEETYFPKYCSDLYDSDESEYDDNKSAAIVSCIKSGKTDKHLLDIKSHKVYSNHQANFDEAVKSSDYRLLSNSTIPINLNVETLKDISMYLMNLFEKTVEGGKGQMYKYVVYVWLPESIAKAIILSETDALSSPDIFDPESTSYSKNPKQIVKKNVNDDLNVKTLIPNESLMLSEVSRCESTSSENGMKKYMDQEKKKTVDQVNSHSLTSSPRKTRLPKRKNIDQSDRKLRISISRTKEIEQLSKKTTNESFSVKTLIQNESLKLSDVSCSEGTSENMNISMDQEKKETVNQMNYHSLISSPRKTRLPNRKKIDQSDRKLRISISRTKEIEQLFKKNTDENFNVKTSIQNESLKLSDVPHAEGTSDENGMETHMDQEKKETLDKKKKATLDQEKKATLDQVNSRSLTSSRKKTRLPKRKKIDPRDCKLRISISRIKEIEELFKKTAAENFNVKTLIQKKSLKLSDISCLEGTSYENGMKTSMDQEKMEILDQINSDSLTSSPKKTRLPKRKKIGLSSNKVTCTLRTTYKKRCMAWCCLEKPCDK